MIFIRIFAFSQRVKRPSIEMNERGVASVLHMMTIVEKHYSEFMIYAMSMLSMNSPNNACCSASLFASFDHSKSLLPIIAQV